MTRSPRTFAGYVRVSRQGEREDDRFRSPAFQRETIERYAAGEGLALTMYPDEIDVSGSKAKRPTLEAIVVAIERGELAGLVVAKLDRLSRLAPRHRLELFERIEARAASSSRRANRTTFRRQRVASRASSSSRSRAWSGRSKADGFVSRANAIANGIAVKRTAPFVSARRGRHRIEPLEASSQDTRVPGRARPAATSSPTRARPGESRATRQCQTSLKNGRFSPSPRRRAPPRGRPSRHRAAELFRAVGVAAARRGGARMEPRPRADALAGIAVCGMRPRPPRPLKTHGGSVA